MEDPGAGARGREERRGVVPQLSDGGVPAVAATPQPGGGLLMDCGAQEARLFTSEEAEKGLDSAVGSGDPLEAASAFLEGRMCVAKGSSSEERPVGMEEEKGGSLPFAPPAEPVRLQTFRAPSGGFSDKALHGLSSKAGCSKDGRCINGTLDKTTEGSPWERADLPGNRAADWRDVAEVKPFMEDFDMDSEEANHNYEGSSDSMKPASEQWPHGVNGFETIPDTNSVAQHNDLVPNIKTEICKPLPADSVSSVSGCIDVSVDGKAAQFHKNSGNPVTSHVTDGGLRSINCACDPAGCMCDRVGMVTEGSVSSGAVDAKATLNNLEIQCNGLNSSVRKSCGPGSINETRQISRKYGIPESSSERDLHSSYTLWRQCDGKPCFSGREPSALCLGQDSGVGEFNSTEFNACNSADDKAGSVDFVSNVNATESQNQQVSTVLVFRRRNPKRAASSRNLRSEKPNQIKKASSGSPRPKKGDIAESLYQITKSSYPNNMKRGRSDSNRPHKSSAWGSLETLLCSFSQSDGPLTSNSHPVHLENEMSSKRPAQMNVSIWKCRGSRSSKNRCSTFSDVRHLTDELNERHAYSTIVNTDASLGSRREVVSEGVPDTSEFTDGANTQHLKRDLACSIREMCAAEIHGECAKLSTSGPPPLKNDSGAGTLPIGFSPDSVLEVASVTCESNASASHDVMLHENSPDTDLKGCDHDSVALPNSYLGRNEAPSVNPFEQQAKMAGMSENMKREQTNSSHTMMNTDAGKGDVQTLQNSKRTRKTSVNRKKGSNKKDRTTKKTLKSRCSSQISSFEASKPRACSNDANLPDSSELPAHKEHSELDSGFEVQTSPQDHGNTHSCSVTDNDKVSAFHTMKSKSPKQKKKDGNAGKKGKVRNSHVKGNGKKQNIEDGDGTSLDRELFNLHSTALATVHTKEQSDPSPTEHAFKNSGIASSDLSGNDVCKTDEASVTAAETSRAAWVCCDDCQKWRCIPAALADVIGEESRWTCKDNRDKAFADCSIPQEKSNAEINAELGLSDVSADEADACKEPSRGSLKKKERSWASIRVNLFLHRNRRTLSIDESMVCNCKPPQDGRMGCRDGCLNRMLNIECVKRTCPCGEQCSNQQFQRRNYAKLRWFYSGKKGYGLQLQEDVSEGRFLIEYVGEVLDIASYELRQQQYALKGQKHFYFMALNGGEVIDACSKGNLGRFINHSCSPNCRTEKWMVNGEVCIGIFAMRNIKKGEELTFDYNYVRVSGAAPQKCFCGIAKCRGYIGGDISVVDTIDRDDTEAGNFADTIVHKSELMDANGSDTHGTNPGVAKTEFSIHGEDLDDLPAANTDLEPLTQIGGTLFDTTDPKNSLDAWCPQEDEDVIRTPVHVSRTIESNSQPFPVHGIQSSDCLQKTPCATENFKAPKIVNGRAPGSDFGGNLVPGSNANKRNKLKDHRNVKQSSPIDNEHILGVEGRLNNLLDRDGGISKRKDATNGYLKLLFLTAAEGDSSGGTSKSVRDLSLILDALLKTKSRAVLLDIINKNGLQMLHNILKQNRSNFHRIPILRKLLKVLEFLALKEILTAEHINGGPRCAGVESFRDSMMCLTRHNDMQVHQIARNFRDRWIPRNTVRSDPKEYPRTSTSVQDFRGNNMVWKSAGRKRKSRWDFQPDEHYKMAGLKFQKAYCGRGPFDVIDPIANKVQGHQGANKYQSDVHGIVNSIESTDDEVPPGFESLQEHRPVQALDCAVAPGICMERYQPSLTISYGIPIALVRHIGTPAAEGQCDQNWKIAPGVPFKPFPPLPPYPRGSPCPSTSTKISQHDGSPNMKHHSSGHYGRRQDREGRVHRTCRNGPRTSLPYSNGKRFQSNHHRFERFQPSRPQ